MFVGLNESQIIPDIFVFLGNFTSRPFDQEQAEANRLKHYFKTLADLISKFPLLAQNSKFIFIPGPADPGIPCLPRPHLPDFLTKILKDKIK